MDQETRLNLLHKALRRFRKKHGIIVRKENNTAFAFGNGIHHLNANFVQNQEKYILPPDIDVVQIMRANGAV